MSHTRLSFESKLLKLKIIGDYMTARSIPELCTKASYQHDMLFVTVRLH